MLPFSTFTYQQFNMMYTFLRINGAIFFKQATKEAHLKLKNAFAPCKDHENMIK